MNWGVCNNINKIIIYQDGAGASAPAGEVTGGATGGADCRSQGPGGAWRSRRGLGADGSRNALVGSEKRNRGKRNRGASCGMERRIAYWEIRCNMRARGQADAGAWETTNSNESITIGGAK